MFKYSEFGEMYSAVQKKLGLVRFLVIAHCIYLIKKIQ